MNASPVVLAVDDDAALLSLIRLELNCEGFHVVTATSGHEALREAERCRPEAAVLDIVMPEMTGIELMRRLKAQLDIRVLLLSAKDEDADKVIGLEMGADDYLTKPFQPAELSARIRAVLRRKSPYPNPERVVHTGIVDIDLDRNLVMRAGTPVALTRTEWHQLQYLARHSGKVVVSAQLLTNVWGPEYAPEREYLRVSIMRLRSKLEADPANPQLIKTHHGIGYSLALNGLDDPKGTESVTGRFRDGCAQSKTRSRLLTI